MNNHTTIVSEIGINGNGNIDIVKKMIKGAKEAGSDLIKFQKRDINKVYSQEELDKYRESPYGLTNRALKEKLEFSEQDYNEIDMFCKEVGIEWFASIWDLESVDFIERYNPKYYKIPSALITYKELYEKIAKLGKYTFIGTGMSTLEEITKIVSYFKSVNCPFQIMHCNSSYPCPDEDLNLSLIPYLKKLFVCDVGYSGHSAGIMDGVIASVLGAKSVEKHITLNRTMFGSDQPASLEIHGLAKMIEYIRYVEVALGDGIKVVTPKELESLKKLRRNFDY